MHQHDSTCLIFTFCMASSVDIGPILGETWINFSLTKKRTPSQHRLEQLSFWWQSSSSCSESIVEEQRKAELFHQESPSTFCLLPLALPVYTSPSNVQGTTAGYEKGENMKFKALHGSQSPWEASPLHRQFFHFSNCNYPVVVCASQLCGDLPLKQASNRDTVWILGIPSLCCSPNGCFLQKKQVFG